MQRTHKTFIIFRLYLGQELNSRSCGCVITEILTADNSVILTVDNVAHFSGYAGEEGFHRLTVYVVT